MKRISLWWFGFVVVSLAALSVARAADINIKMATLAPEGSTWHTILKDMGEQWRKVSNGRVVLKIYPGGVAGDESDMVRKMRVGQIQAGAVTGTGLSEVDRGVQALQVPMLYRSNVELDYVRRKMAPMLEARLKEKGFVVLNWGEAGWVRFFSKTPAARPDDLKRLKLFTWAGDSMALDLWKTGGFKPVPLASTDIMPALQTGIIEVFATPPVAALSFQWYSLAPNMTELSWASLIGATLITEAAWKKIPADAREGILAASKEAGEKVQADVRKGESEAIEAMKQHGLKVVSVPPDAMDLWRQAAEQIYSKLRGAFVPADMFDEAQRLVKEFRSRNQK